MPWAPTGTLRPTTQVGTFSTASLAVGASQTLQPNLGPMWRLMRVETSVPARVRLYANDTRAVGDADRAIMTPPSGNHGMNAEVVTAAGSLGIVVTPTIDGHQSSPVQNAAPMVVTNLHTAAAVV